MLICEERISTGDQRAVEWRRTHLVVVKKLVRFDLHNRLVGVQLLEVSQRLTLGQKDANARSQTRS